MKVIDLLVKIANGEEVPNVIELRDLIYYYDRECSNEFYRYETKEGQLLSDYSDLNDEVEIIEEDKKIDKLYLEKPYPECEDTRFEEVQEKINEIIEVINGRD